MHELLQKLSKLSGYERRPVSTFLKRSILEFYFCAELLKLPPLVVLTWNKSYFAIFRSKIFTLVGASFLTPLLQSCGEVSEEAAKLYWNTQKLFFFFMFSRRLSHIYIPNYNVWDRREGEKTHYRHANGSWELHSKWEIFHEYAAACCFKLKKEWIFCQSKRELAFQTSLTKQFPVPVC